MASNIDFVKYVCEQIGFNYTVRYKKMFGDYIVYVNDKPILLVCDNCVYVKKLDQLKDLMINAECGIPYDGAKEHYILDIENTELTASALAILERITPLAKKKK